MRELALNDELTKEQQNTLLDYCETDVIALKTLLEKMPLSGVLEHMLFRGHYMKAVAHMEWNGISTDIKLLKKLLNHWEGIELVLIKEVNEKYNIFEGRVFKHHKFEQHLAKKRIAWPRLASGNLDTTEETFKKMAEAYSELHPLYQLISIRSKMRTFKLAVGSDGYHRCLLSPFGQKGGRNNPRRYIFGLSKWLRGLIKPKFGTGIAYIDWEQQEFGIGAALSRDENMMKAYLSGDAYLAFGKQIGLIPPQGTKETHRRERDICKSCVFGFMYGMGVKTFAARIKQPPIVAKEIISNFKQVYRKFCEWSNAAVNHVLIEGNLQSVFGWTIHRGRSQTSPRTYRNFPMQANGSDMLRLTCCYLIEDGIKLCGSSHDAVLVEGAIDKIEELTKRTQHLMARGSEKILNGFTLRTEAKIVKYPDRYMESEGEKTWENIISILNRLEKQTVVISDTACPTG